MADTNRLPDSHGNEGPGHEERDVNPFAVSAAGLAIFALVLISVFGMWFVFNLFAQREAAKSPPRTIVGVEPSSRQSLLANRTECPSVAENRSGT